MKTFSFVHAGDLHLDSPFKGITSASPLVADALRSATFKAFEDLIQLCIDKQVDFLLVAGDVYDGADRSLRAQLRFLDGLKRLTENDIPSFVVHGNHDPLNGWSSSIEWPKQVHVFRSGQVETHFAKKNGEDIAAVSGISFQNRDEPRNLTSFFGSTNPDLFQIGLLHCNCGKNQNYENYAPCSVADLSAVGLDYWALGHVHERQILCSNPYIVYPGNTQGRSIREQGQKGCYLVSVHDNNLVDIQFNNLSAIEWRKLDRSIEGIETIDGLEDALNVQIQELSEKENGRPTVCRITLTGRGQIYEELRREFAIADLLERQQQFGLTLEPYVWVESISLKCSPEFNLSKRRKENDLLGQVLRESQTMRQKAEQKEDQKQELLDFLAPALSELFQNRRIGKSIEPLTEDSLHQLLSEAELLCVDYLEKSS